MDLITLGKIESVGSSLAKEALLKTLGNDTIPFLVWALDPMITFGVTVDEASLLKLHRGNTSTTSEKFWLTFDGLCKQLSSRLRTGHAAVDSIREVMKMAPDDEHIVWACRILNKDLRSGFSLTTLNKAHPGSIEPFACSLAKPYDPEKHEIRGPWCVQPKLDGLRMVVVNGVAYTRNGRTIDTAGHILQEFAMYPDFVFDGEIMGKTNFDQDSGKIRKKGEGANKSLMYNVFDCIPVQDWHSRKTESYRKRYDRLELLMADVKPVNSELVKSEFFAKTPTTEQLFAARDKFIKLGYEGAMLKDLNAPYYFKRSDSILKLKEFLDADGIIVEAFEGKGRLKGTLGGFGVTFDGVVTRVGSGFSDEQRQELWKKKDQMLGKMLEAKYQNKTVDGALRFPVFIKMRPDRD